MAIKKIDNMCQRKCAFKHIKNPNKKLLKKFIYITKIRDRFIFKDLKVGF